MIPYRHEHTDLRDFRISTEPTAIPAWPLWLAIFMFLLGLTIGELHR